MIDLYSWKTPNGRKVSIMLEEVGLPYEVHPINLSKDEQFAPEYLALNPNNKIPTIVDGEGPEGKPYTLFESGAILMYLAEKTGKLLPSETAKRYHVIQWLMFQMAASTGEIRRSKTLPTKARTTPTTTAANKDSPVLNSRFRCFSPLKIVTRAIRTPIRKT